MLIAILVISILNFVFILIEMREINDRIINLEVTIDEIKEQNEK